MPELDRGEDPDKADRLDFYFAGHGLPSPGVNEMPSWWNYWGRWGVEVLFKPQHLG